MNESDRNPVTVNPMGRRTFLAGTAAAATMTVLKPSLVSGTKANAKVTLGMIGCGGRGAWIANLFQQDGEYQIAAAADYFEDRARGVAGKFNVPADRVFTGLKCHEKLIEKGGLDAVAVISPPFFRPEQVRMAVKAGLHVYAAKPLAVDVPGCTLIKKCGEEATEKGLVFLVDFQTRANEFYKEALKRVHGGALGTLAFCEASYHGGRLGAQAPPGSEEARLRNWVFDIKLSGDVIVEQFIHALDVMSWGMKHAPPVRCTGTGGRKVRVDVGDCWDYFTLTYEYADKVGVAFSGRQFDGHGEPEGIINRMFGSQGTLHTEYGGKVLIRGGEKVFYRGGTTGGIYQEGAQANIRTFRELVGRKDVTNATVEASVLSNMIAIMGRTAAYTGRTVTWDEVTKSTEVYDPNLKGLKS
jgi:predicted dehydrogenase